MTNNKKKYSKPELIVNGAFQEITKGECDDKEDDYGWGCFS